MEPIKIEVEEKKFYNQSTINAIFYYLRSFIETVNLLWLFPAILTTQQIGLYKLITTTSFMVAYIIQIGMPQGIVKYFPKFEKQKKGFLGFILVNYISIFFTFLVIAFIFEKQVAKIFKNKAEAIIEHFNLIILASFFLVSMMILKGLFRSLFKTIVPNFIQNVLVFSLISFSAVLHYFNILNFNNLLYSIPVIFGIGLFFMVIYLIYLDEFKIKIQKSFFKLAFIKEFTYYNICTIIGQNSFSIVTKIDSIMISSLIGLKFNGIYAIVVSITKLIEIPRKATKQLSTPLISNLINKEKWDSVKKSYINISLNQFIFGMYLSMLLFANINDIINLIPNEEIKNGGKTIVFFLAITKLIDTSMGIGNDIILMSKHFWFNVVALLILTFVSILTNYFMIPIWGIVGASAATAISFLIYNVVICIFVKIKTGLHPFSIKIVYITFFGVFSSGVIKLLALNLNNVYNIIINSISISLIYLSLIYFFNMSDEFTSFINKKFKLVNKKSN